MPSPSGSKERTDWFGASIAGLVVIVFSLLLLWHDPLVFWNDDYQLSILPVFADIARSWNEGQLPLLSPYSWVCSNLAGEFQYGTFSVFINAAVVLIWKFPLTFPEQAAALSISHLFVLAAGAFLLARDRALPRSLATLVALVAALNGWIICWGATDWFGALGAFAWFPWCWWALERSLKVSRETASQELGPPRLGRKLAATIWPAPFVYLLVTGGFPYTVVMLAVLTAWLFVRQVFRAGRLMAIVPTLLGIALGFGLSAPAWLALLDYVHGSNRAAQSGIAHWQWLVPIKALPGFILPSWTVSWTDFSSRSMPHRAADLACGLVPPVALLWGLVVGGRRFVRQIGWELGLLVFVLAISMLPSAGFFRWSFRWLPFLHLIMAICAAEALQLAHERRPSLLKTPAFLGLGLVLLGTAAGFLFGKTGEYGNATSICAGLMAVAWLGSMFASQKMSDWAAPVVAFGAFLTTYFVIPPNCGVPKYNLSQELLNPAPLSTRRLYLSIYPPAENTYRTEKKPEPVGQIVRPGSTSMWAGLHFINGYSPVLASGVAREFKFAIHGEFDWDEQKLLLETEGGEGGLLDVLGVDGIVVAVESGLAPAPADEWEMVFESEEGKVYHRLETVAGSSGGRGHLPSVPHSSFGYLVANGDVAKFADFAPVTIGPPIKVSRNSESMNVDAGTRSGTFLFRRPYFRGYRAWLNGREVPVESWRGLIPAVELRAGSKGQLLLVYRPWWLVWGGAAAELSLLLVVALGIVARRSRSERALEAVVPTA